MLRRLGLSRSISIALAALIPASLCAIHLLNGTAIYGSIITVFFRPYRLSLEKSFSNGTLPLFAPEFGAGFPIHADSQGGFLNPLHLVSVLFFGADVGNSVGLALHLIVFSVGTHLYLRNLGVRNWISLFGATLSILGVGLHVSIVHSFTYEVIAFIPWAMLAVDRFAEKRSFRFLLLFLLCWLLQLSVGHFQYQFFSLILYLCYAAVVFSKLGLLNWAKRMAQLMFALGFGFCLLGVQTLPTAELLIQGSRSELGNWRQMLDGSVPPWHLVELWTPYLRPLLYNSRPDYLARLKLNLVEGYVYVGVLPTLICLVALFTPARELGLAGFKPFRAMKLLLVMQTVRSLGWYIGIWIPLMYLPGFGNFRVPSRNLLLLEFLIVCLACLTTEKLLSAPAEVVRAFARRAGRISLVMGLLSVGVTAAIHFFGRGAPLAGFYSASRESAYMLLPFLLLFLIPAALKWALVCDNRRMQTAIAGGIGLLTLGELILFTGVAPKHYRMVSRAEMQQLNKSAEQLCRRYAVPAIDISDMGRGFDVPAPTSIFSTKQSPAVDPPGSTDCIVHFGHAYHYQWSTLTPNLSRTFNDLARLYVKRTPPLSTAFGGRPYLKNSEVISGYRLSDADPNPVLRDYLIETEQARRNAMASSNGLLKQRQKASSEIGLRLAGLFSNWDLLRFFPHFGLSSIRSFEHEGQTFFPVASDGNWLIRPEEGSLFKPQEYAFGFSIPKRSNLATLTAFYFPLSFVAGLFLSLASFMVLCTALGARYLVSRRSVIRAQSGSRTPRKKEAVEFA